MKVTQDLEAGMIPLDKHAAFTKTVDQSLRCGLRMVVKKNEKVKKVK